MVNHSRVSPALLVVLVVAACGPATPTPSPSVVAQVQPSAAVVSATPSPSPSPTASPLATATPIPTPSPIPTPVPWKSYTSTLYHYTIKYPPTWVVTPGTAKISDQFDGYSYPYVYVDRDVISSGTISISVTTTHDIAYYKSHYNAKVLTNKSLTVAGWPARLLIFDGMDNGVRILFQHLDIARGRVGYFIDMEGYFGDAAADKALFKKIYSTFRRR